MEYAETLLPSAEGENQKLIYQFQDHGNRQVALRFDHTVPLARFIASHQHELVFPFKRYVVGNVFRGESPQAGRYREFTQFDFDCIGTDSAHADLEILLVIVDALQIIGLRDFELRINNRQFFDLLVEHLELRPALKDILRLVDKYDKIGPDKLLEELKDIPGLSNEKANIIVGFIQQNTLDPQAFAHYLEQTFPTNKAFSQLFWQLHWLVEQVERLTKHHQITIDLKIARGLDYYTGLVVETFLLKAPKLGSICSGGRYDGLLANFSRQPMPAIGASFGLDRLLSFLEQQEKESSIETKRVYLAILEETAFDRGQDLAHQMRQAGIEVYLLPETERMKKHFSLSSKLKMDYLIGIGGSELIADSYTLANLTNGEKKTGMASKDIINHILSN